MATFLNTTGVSYHLENLINNSQEKLILISPFLKINDRIKELLTDKNTLKIDIRIIYGKNELQPEESNWLKNLNYVRLSFCKNLHAKCYLNEKEAIVTSMNLYDFSQINNNEMGIYILKNEDHELYKDIEEEARRLIRSSDEGKDSVKKIVHKKYLNPTKKNLTAVFVLDAKKQLNLIGHTPIVKTVIRFGRSMRIKITKRNIAICVVSLISPR